MKPIYVEAIGRNPGEERQHSHLYLADQTGIFHHEYTPMCRYGWNRSDGSRLSIFRGHTGAKGLCKICARRAKLGLPGVTPKRTHTRPSGCKNRRQPKSKLSENRETREAGIDVEWKQAFLLAGKNRGSQ